MERKIIHVIKVGGAVLEDPAKLQVFLKGFSSIQQDKILIHGGGRVATDIGKKLGIQPVMIEGRRVTDNATLDLVTMVYGGLINKKLVATLQNAGMNGIGLTGADGSLIISDKRPVVEDVDYGWVGDPKGVNVQVVLDLLDAGLVPVIAPITHDGKGQLFNTNADTMAGAMAIALAQTQEVHLHLTFEMDGVMQDVSRPESLIKEITRAEFESLKKEGKIHSGMIPKLENAFAALEEGVISVRICKFDKVNAMQSNGTRLKI